MDAYHIHMFRSQPHVSFSLANWCCGKEPVLFLTGLSGAGKTSLLQTLERQYRCTAITLDALRFYDNASANSQQAVDDFLALYPCIRKYVQKSWSSNTSGFCGEREYTKYTNLFVEFLAQQAVCKEQKYIIEGIQLFVRIPPKTLCGRPKIILGTSGLLCFWNAMQRDFPRPSFLGLPRLLKRFFRYSVIQKIRLNYYLRYWQKTETFNAYQKRQSR